MSAFKLGTLKEKLWAIVAASFVARVIMFFILPSTPSSLAPDEGTYAALTKWIAESKPATDFPAYGEGLYLSGRSIIIPSSALNRIGMNELDAVRLVSSFYGFLSLLLLTFLAVKLLNRRDDLSKFNTRLVLLFFTIFAFLPSHFVWSTLGLREGPNEFWVLLSFVSVYVIFHFKTRQQVLAYFALFASIVMCFSTRPQAGLVLGVGLLIYLVSRIKQTKALLAISAVLTGIVLGSIATSGNVGVSILEDPGVVITMVDGIPTRHTGNQVDAASVIETPNCPLSQNSVIASTPSRVDTYACILWRAPYTTSTFLLRPFIVGDVTSTSSAFAAIENLIWFLAFGLIAYFIVKRRGIPRFNQLAPSMIFFALYVVGAGAYEGNMGTAFRHKSLILWVVLALLLSLLWRNSQNPTEDSRNKSAESAV
ncbi:MAG: hypothetical protein K9G01_00975 [Candidatus Planktophila sp.]|nr:hypothetical protein [Candidatus Planktophila sp.]